MHFGGLINRKDETMKKGRILIILVIAVLMLLPACDSGKQEINVVHNGGSDFPIDKVSPEWDSVKLGFLTPFDNIEEFKNGEDGKTIEYITDAHPQELDYIMEAHLVMTGIVLGFDLQEELINSGIRYHIEPTEVFRGNPKTDENGLVDVLTSGGQNETHMLYITLSPPLTVGNEYLFFLNDPISNGKGVNTNNVGYYTYKEARCFTVSEAGGEDKFFAPYYYYGIINSEGTDVLHAILRTDFIEKIEKINSETPVPTDSEMRKEYVDRWRYTIDTYVSDGRMTQEEYDEAKAWLDDYEFYTGD